MNRKRFGQIRRIIACCFAAIALLCHALPTLAETAAQGNSTHASGGETVRIGLYDKDSYHVIDENDRHSGYDHEYLQEISKYTGWNYEFVEGSWQECIEMIESGEIDLLGGVALHDEWKNTMCYAAEASANSSNCLLVDSQSMKYAYEDFDAFDGIRIGILTDSSIPDDIAIYAAENNFRYTLNQYATENELNAALANGEVDCLGLSDFRNLSSYKIIARISNTPLYYVTSLNRCDLKAQLDDALHRIHAQNKFYEYDLYDKYFNSAHQVAFTREEMAYIEANRHVRVALFQDIPMISTYVPSKDEYEGFIITILGRLSEKTGLQFEFIDVPTNQVPWDFLYENPNVLLAPLFQNNLIHYSERMRFLDTIVPSNMVAVTRSTESLASVSSGDALTLAIPSGMFGATQEIKELFVNCEIIFCQSHQEGLDLVCDGKADLTLINEILWTYLIQSPRYENLKTFYLNHIVEDVTIGMSTSSDILLNSILNKAIQSFSQRDIQQIVMEHTSTHPYKLSFGETIYKNRLYLSLVLLSLMMLSIPMIWIHSRRQQNQAERQHREVTEARLKTAEIYQKELYHQANYDVLTGLYNQKHFVERANDLMKWHPSYIYTFFHVNIANFKTINESYGLKQGDAVLLETARELKRIAGEEGLYGRLYADQFVLCLCLSKDRIDNLPNYQTAYQFDCGGQIIHIQAQVGVYVNSEHVSDAEQAITYALVALQKHEGTSENHIYFYKEKYLDELLRKQIISNEMKNALKTGQFQIYLQPQYNIENKKLVSAEALVRWVHPTLGMISPNEFIPTLEANLFISKLDIYVFEEVCRLLTKWKKQGKWLPISVNLSRMDLQNKKLLPTLLAILDKYALPAQLLHLEITESAYVEEHEQVYQTIEGLRKAGFMVEMDDFGSGYSALNMLKDIPVDVLKLDMKFFNGEANMDRGGSIIDAIVKMAHTLGIVVVAEGVETRREENFLESIHCKIAQGYLYGRPVPIGEFERILDTSRVGDKMQVIEQAKEEPSQKLYWELEQLNMLLLYSHVILFEYDPVSDEAVFTAGKIESDLITMEMSQYVQKLKENPLIHPDYREVIQEVLHSQRPGAEDLDFKADCYRTGTFEWYHAKIHRYCHDKKINKVMGILVRESTPPPVFLMHNRFYMT